MESLADSAFRATLKVRKIHAEIELKDYQFVLKYYDDQIPAFEIILEEVERLTAIISRADKALREL
jgi:hypothetical protein